MLIFGGEGIVSFVDILLCVLHGYLIDIEGVFVLLDHSSLGCLTVMHTRLNFLLHQAHLGHNSLNFDELIDEL